MTLREPENPGTGKSIMTIFLNEELEKGFSATHGRTLIYFCDSGFDTRKTATAVIRGLLQLVQQHPQFLDYLLAKSKERGADLSSCLTLSGRCSWSLLQIGALF